MIKIYRRLFNPPKVNGTVQPNPRLRVATFQPHMQTEAEFCFARLQEISINFSSNVPHFSHFRYYIEIDAPPITPPGQNENIIVDTSTARPTKRPITFTLSWSIKHEMCDILAFTEKYGAVRAQVEDSPAGRQLFVRRLTSVWPNAKQKK